MAGGAGAKERRCLWELKKFRTNSPRDAKRNIATVMAGQRSPTWEVADGHVNTMRAKGRVTCLGGTEAGVLGSSGSRTQPRVI